MHRATATERDHRASFIGFARFDGVHPRGVGHVLIDHFDHAECCDRRFQAKLVANMRGQSNNGCFRHQLHRAAGKPCRIVAAKREVGVGHRREQSATAIAGRARIGAGGFRTNTDAAKAVDMGDGPTASADLDHLDHRYPQWQTGPFAKPSNAGHFEATRGLRAEIVDQADLGRGAPHVERQHLRQFALAGDGGREDRPAGRAGFHQADRKPAGGCDGGEATAGQHHEDGSRQSDGPQIGFEHSQITRHHRLHIGVGGGGGKPLPLPHFRRNLGCQRHRQIRQSCSQDVAHAALVDRVDETVQETDRHTLNLFAHQHRHQGVHGRFVERAQDVALVVESLRHGQPQMARHQRLGQHDVDVVLVVAALIAQRQHIAEPLGGDQRGAGPLALDHRIGGKRGAMHQDGDVARL